MLTAPSVNITLSSIKPAGGGFCQLTYFTMVYGGGGYVGYCFPTNTLCMHVRLLQDSLGQPLFTDDDPQKHFCQLFPLISEKGRECIDGGRERGFERGGGSFFSDFDDVYGRHRRMKLQQTGEIRITINISSNTLITERKNNDPILWMKKPDPRTQVVVFKFWKLLIICVPL